MNAAEHGEGIYFDDARRHGDDDTFCNFHRRDGGRVSGTQDYIRRKETCDPCRVEREASR